MKFGILPIFEPPIDEGDFYNDDSGSVILPPQDYLPPAPIDDAIEIMSIDNPVWEPPTQDYCSPYCYDSNGDIIYGSPANVVYDSPMNPANDYSPAHPVDDYTETPLIINTPVYESPAHPDIFSNTETPLVPLSIPVVPVAVTPIIAVNPVTGADAVINNVQTNITDLFGKAKTFAKDNPKAVLIVGGILAYYVLLKD